MPKKASTTADGEHIFPATKLTALAVQWKQLNAAGRHKEAMLVLEDIVKGSTSMFERLAQFEDFHYTVDLPILVSAAQEKVVKWLNKWEPKKGKLFSWFSKCAKNAFKSELVKVNQYRKRYHVTSDNLEKFYGVEDHEIDKHDVASDIDSKLEEMTCRWADPQQRGAIRYVIRCVVEDSEHDSRVVIRSAAYAYCISHELSKYFYGWTLSALRREFHERVYVPFTDQDLIRASESYTDWPDIVDEIGVEAAKKLVMFWGGKRIKVPSVQHVAKLRESYNLMRDIERSDQDPDSVASVAKKYRKTARAATEIFNDMVERLDPSRYGEHSIFSEDSA